MEKEPSNPEVDFEITKIYLNTLQQIIFARLSVILVIPTLALAILVIASFNEKIIPVTPMLKVWIVILLALIPITIWDHTFKLAKGQNEMLQRLAASEALNKTVKEEIMHGSSLIYMAMIFVIIICIIDLIVPSLLYTLSIAAADLTAITALYYFHLKK